MPAREIVSVMRQYIDDDGAGLEERYGPQAVTLAGDIVAVVRARLTEGDLQRVKSAHASLWDTFESTPETVTVEMTGVLESLFEADAGLARRLNGLMERFHQVQANTAQPAGGVQGLPAPQSPPAPSSADAIHDADQDDVEEAGGYAKGEGLYLYGNVHTAVPFTDEPGVQIVSLGGRGPEAALGLEAAGVPEFFERMGESVRTHPALDPDARRELLSEFGALQRALSRQADPGDLAHHLRNVRRISSDVWDLLQSYWDTETYTDASSSAMQKAIREVRA